MKLGLIRCMQTEDMCLGTTCFKVIKEKKLAFEGIDEDIETCRNYAKCNRKENREYN